MQILPEHVINFRSESGFVVSSGILPVTGYIKIEYDSYGYTLYRSNIHSFYKKHYPYSFESSGSILIEMKVLFNFAEQVSGPIQLSLDEKNVTLRCGKKRALAQMLPADNFPTIPEPIGGAVDLDSGLVAIANNFIVDDDIPALHNHVFIGDGYLCACDKFIGFRHDIDPTISNAVLRKEMAAAFPKEGLMKYYSGGNFHIGQNQSGGFLGFIKPEINYLNISSIFSAIDNPDFTINKKDVLAFCKYCMSTNPDKIVQATLQCVEDGVSFNMVPNAYGYKYDILIETQTIAGPIFKFNTDMMTRLLRGLPEEMISFHPGKDKYCMKGAGDWVAMIMGIMN